MHQHDDTEAILQLMRDKGAGNLELPPKVFVEMGAIMESYDEESQTLIVRFPVQQRWQNPAGAMQGGIIAAAIDNCIGPLSFIVAPPSVTTQLSISYVRPVTPDMPFIRVYGLVTEITRRQIFLSAKVTDMAGKTLAMATSTCVIVASS